ncbi:hypothetical protein [Lactiplantibacillus mudanjiangensis]|uniref:Uncharacterized protein n=1 Tax=Lactiplantibacillus mudanjiangensis TaxID=1296538 RepID=A0A660E6Q4_9LACO|nr:hypothetical protein [Lactiplantibacillus mudanjiangensis]VDG18178.1 hypothetical protein [Lactobacillus sp. CBA3605] [Lactiplantibacillus mudanjiangensis]VDG25866.1 hypothetical protein [Lactobacillus sp. CBA3605] [Lactiplantibacillus mudanjiangensis]VDG28705.1 hypothetical protein [Lactobacillus sp. CBA3605] [Lactiplantibacillus mudanjiangensis]VDG33701.1 hypothetical protein [Lactobacillus sp. CBA3605] [Lactiplantibacillus mudanjiangensis]
MSAIRDDLAKAIKGKQLVEIYSKGTNEQFSVGYILQQDDKFVLVEAINVDGELDGIVVFRKASLAKIVTGTDYLKSMATIVSLAQQRGYFDVWNTEHLVMKFLKKDHQHSLLKSMLKLAFKKDQVIQLSGRIKKHGDTYTGFIHSEHKKYIEFNYVDTFDLSKRPQIAVRYAEIDEASFHNFETFNITAVIESYMPGDFH